MIKTLDKKLIENKASQLNRTFREYRKMNTKKLSSVYRSKTQSQKIKR